MGGDPRGVECGKFRWLGARAAGTAIGFHSQSDLHGGSWPPAPVTTWEVSLRQLAGGVAVRRQLEFPFSDN